MLNLDIDARGDCAHTLVDYGDELKNNKALLNAALIKANILDRNVCILLMSMAMLETTTLNTAHRDTTKDDCTNGATNVSLFNLNTDMIKELKFSYTNDFLNDPKNLYVIVHILITAIRLWGVNRLLNFVRGGRTAFNDGHSYGAADYRNTILSIYKVVKSDISLMTDSRRVQIYLQHV